MRFLITGMLLLYFFGASSLAAQVIVNESAAEFDIPPQELRLIFSKQKLFWPDGQPIAVYILSPDSKLHKEFCVKQLDLMPYMLHRRWDRLVYSGTGERPIVIESEALMRERIKMTPGAIGYISDQVSVAGGRYVQDY